MILSKSLCLKVPGLHIFFIRLEHNSLNYVYLCLITLLKYRSFALTLSVKHLLFLLFLALGSSLGASMDSTVTEEPPGFRLFQRKNKPKKYKYKPHSNRSKPSSASILRLKSQSKKARHSMSRNRNRNSRHQKATWKRQKKQKSYSRRKNHIKHKPSRFDKRTKIKKIRKVYLMDNKGK